MKEYRPNTKLKRSYATMGIVYTILAVFSFYYLYALNKTSIIGAVIASGLILTLGVMMLSSIFINRIVLTGESIKISSPFQNRELLFREIASLDITDKMIKINGEDRNRAMQFSTSYEGIEEIKDSLVKAYKR